MWLLEGLAELIAPTRCAGCDDPGSLLCARCEPAIAHREPDASCPRCGAPYGVLVCTECWQAEFAFEAALSLGELNGPLARALVLHKDAGERRLGPLLGARLAQRVAGTWPDWAQAVTWVPATHAALARRGFDHARALAEPIAATLDAPLVGLLERRSAADQRQLGRAGRASNAAGSFAAARDAHRTPERVLIVDDVLTTGATLDAAALTLLEAGAAAVRVAACARAW